MKQSHQVEIFGQVFTVRSEKNEAFVNRVVEMVDSRMRGLAGASANVTPLSAAVLSAMNLAEELLQLQERQETEGHRLEAVARRIERELSSLSCS